MKKNKIFLILLILCSCVNDTDHVVSVLVSDTKISRAENTFYYNGKKFTGIIRTTMEDDKNEMLMEVKNGLMHGKYMEWNADHILRTERQYKNGLEHGLQKGYHSDGSLLFEYVSYEGEMTGGYKEDLPNGQLARPEVLQDKKSRSGRE